VSEPTSGESGDVRSSDASVAPAGVPAPPPSSVEPEPEAAPPYPGPGLPYPVTAAPYPVTGMPYPVTGMPYAVTGMPYPVIAPPPPPRRNAAVIVLGIATGVLLLVSGGLGALYYLDHGDATRTNAEQQAEIVDLQAQVSQLEDDLDDTESRLRRAEDDLLDAEACPDAVQAFIDLAVNAALSGQQPTEAEAQQALFDMMDACGVSA